MPALLGYLRRPALIDDICQLRRIRLLVRTSEDRPRITDYTGRGALLSIHEAFSALSSDERHLLRLYFVDRLTTYELGTLFGMSQPTISRWLKSVRQTIYDQTWSHLQARLRLAGRDFQSFLAVLDSQLDISISQIFKEEDALAQPSGVEARKAVSPKSGA